MKAFILLLIIPLLFPVYANDELIIDDFADSMSNRWKKEVFNQETIYEITHYQSQPALSAISKNSASGLIYTYTIDLNKTPWLNWSWAIDQGLPKTNERIKSGDDFAARVYIIHSGGLQFWNTRSLSYVWSSSADIGQHWPSPFTNQAHMFVLRSGDKRSKRWTNEKRNIKQDFERVFGEAIDKIHAIAIMTDTDNTGQMSQAYYGKIFFTSQ